MRYGWEDDIPSIWMNYFNDELLKMGMITEDEHTKMKRIIPPLKGLHADGFHGKINKP